VLVRDGAHGLDVVGVLALTGGLLHQLVGDIVARDLVTDDHAEIVILSEIAAVVEGKVAEGTGVGVVLGNDWIEVMVCLAAAGTATKSVFTPHVLSTGEAVGTAEAATAKDDLPVKAGLGIALGVDFDDAAHLAAVLGGKAGGIDAQRFDVVGFDFGAEAGGAIVGEWDSVDDELRLIFGASRMKDCVALIEPSGLGVNQILNGAAGERAQALLDAISGDLVDGASLIRVDQSVGGCDGDRFAYRFQLKLNCVAHGNG